MATLDRLLQKQGWSSRCRGLGDRDFLSLAQELDGNEPARAVAAAEVFWRVARTGEHFPAPVLEALRAALSNAAPNVPFYASIALRHHAVFHTHEDGPPVALIRPDPGHLPSIDGSARGCADDCRSSFAPIFATDSSPLPDMPAGRCGVCASLATTCILQDGGSSNAGGCTVWEYVCTECGCYTVHDRSWG